MYLGESRPLLSAGLAILFLVQAGDQPRGLTAAIQNAFATGYRVVRDDPDERHGYVWTRSCVPITVALVPSVRLEQKPAHRTERNRPTS